MGQALTWHGLPSDQWAKMLPDTRDYVARMCRKHGELGRPLAYDYLKSSHIIGPVEANRRLRTQSEFLELGKTGLTATVHDGELKKWCERKAEDVAVTCEQFTQRGSVENAIHYAQRAVAESGLTFPILGSRGFVNDTEAGPNSLNDYILPMSAATNKEWGHALARVFDPLWWRRQARRIQSRKIEAVARDIRLVSASTGIYASEITVNRRQKQRDRNREMLEQLEAVSDTGEVVGLIDCVKASTSNPVNRRHELMVRMRGFEECAVAAGHEGLFTTITAPSKYHAMSRNKKSGRAYKNPKFAGATPRDVQQYFCRVWSQIRAQLWREEIRPYGFRIAEPHHDGTPHWHMMLHVEPENLDRLKAIISEYALNEDGGEPGAAQQRVKHVVIDPAKGTAAGYIAKYVAKNIDGENIEEDLYGRDAKNSARRIEAWASAWGIRQFQQIGGASVTVWRELRRLKLDDELAQGEKGSAFGGVSKEERAKFLQAWFAADSSDWAAYTMVQGGVNVRRDEQLIRAQYEEDGKNKYYEEARRLTGVLVAGVQSVVSRAVRWTVQRAGDAAKALQDRVGGYVSGAMAVAADEWADILGPGTSVAVPVEGKAYALEGWDRRLVGGVLVTRGDSRALDLCH